MQGLPNKNKNVYSRRILWLIFILEKICLGQFQNRHMPTLPRFDWGFCGQNSTEFEACAPFCDSLPNQWPISIEYHWAKVDLSILFRRCPHLLSSKQWKNNTIYRRKCQREKENFPRWASPPNENRTGVFKQGTLDLSRTWQLLKTTGVFTEIDCVLLFVWKVGKPFKAFKGKKGWKAELSEDERVVQSS